MERIHEDELEIEIEDLDDSGDLDKEAFRFVHKKRPKKVRRKMTPADKMKARRDRKKREKRNPLSRKKRLKRQKSYRKWKKRRAGLLPDPIRVASRYLEGQH